MRKLISMLAITAVAIGGAVLMATSAHAQGPLQLTSNNGYYVNAWNGGPQIATYSQAGVNNNFFDIEYNSGQHAYNIVFAGQGVFQGSCIGDENNNSGKAQAYLAGVCSSSAVPWGANFTERPDQCSNGLIAFQDNHWGGYLTNGVTGGGNDQQIWLNDATPTCFQLIQ